MRNKFPYGISNFLKLMTENYVFVDKSKYIEILENLSSQYHFLLRPRRFGKSLFISMLTYYYGIEHKDKFETLFGELYIGKNPTPKASSYLVLNFEFSRIDTTDFQSTFNGFLSNVKLGFQDFFNKYNDYFSPENIQEILAKTDPNEVFKAFSVACKQRKTPPIYLLIDEYDHFANEIIAFNFNEFSNIVSRNGFVRKFYESIKTATMDGVVDRMFVTGVTPITLDSLTSGFNISTDLTMHQFFNEAMGFVLEEVEELVGIACQQQDCDKERIFKDLKEWYNGYLFNYKSQKRIYNSDMVLYFLNKLQESKEYPDDLLDTNIASDYGKIKRFFNLKNPEQNYTVLDKLLSEGEITSEIIAKFSFEREFTRADFISLLYYMGFISIKETKGTLFVLRMPNYVIQSLYFDFFAEIVAKRAEVYSLGTESLQEAMLALMFEGDFALFSQEVQTILQKLSNRDAMQFSEKHLKMVIFTLLNLNKTYYIKSEYETQKKYVDILLLERNPFKVNFQYALELKYLPKEKAEKREEVKKEAISQLKGYLQREELRELQNLKSFILLVVGDELEVIEVL